MRQGWLLRTFYFSLVEMSVLRKIHAENYILVMSPYWHVDRNWIFINSI